MFRGANSEHFAILVGAVLTHYQCMMDKDIPEIANTGLCIAYRRTDKRQLERNGIPFVGINCTFPVVFFPRMWNYLPDDTTFTEFLSTFHQRLKTHLFPIIP